MFAFVRRDRDGNEIIVVSNFTPVATLRLSLWYRSAGPLACEVLNSDSGHYHGSNAGNGGEVRSDRSKATVARSHCLTLPPLATLWLVREAE
ncbi:alpha amylase C-terminal domain-containing protein [Escherichia coli]